MSATATITTTHVSDGTHIAINAFSTGTTDRRLAELRALRAAESAVQEAIARRLEQA